MKNKIIYGILIFFLIISDFVYINAFVSGGFTPNDVSNDPSNLITPLLFLINIISLIVGLTKINKQKLIASILIILSLPTIVLSIWMLTHKNDFNPHINNSIKSNLANIRAKIVDGEPNSYSNICEDPQVVGYINEAKKIGNETKCFGDNDSFVVTAKFHKPLDEKTYFCVDSLGSAKSITTQQNSMIIGANSLCPQE